jgi:hypothetical protein
MEDCKAIEACRKALLAWKRKVHKYLSEIDKPYAFTLVDAHLVQSETDKAINAVLADDNYYETELRLMQESLEASIKAESPRKCKQIMLYFLWRFGVILETLK